MYIYIYIYIHFASRNNRPCLPCQLGDEPGCEDHRAAANETQLQKSANAGRAVAASETTLTYKYDILTMSQRRQSPP